MACNAHKEKLLVLLNILESESDPDHPLSTTDLIRKLDESGIKAERKSLYADVAALKARGYDIILERGRGYYLGARTFEIAELKLLVDAVQSSKFISESKSRALIQRLGKLCSIYQARALQRQVTVAGRVKTMNESVLYSIDAIYEAISENKKLTFLYFDYNAKKEKVFRHNSKKYLVSPVGLLRSDECYYLIAIDEESGDRRHYRVDRMYSPDISKADRVPGCNEIDMGVYARRHFGMFSGQNESVRLRCPVSISHVILDRFGMDIMMIPDGKDFFTVTVDVVVSQQFYGWLFGLGSGVEILFPKHVRDEYAERLTDCALAHNHR